MIQLLAILCLIALLIGIFLSYSLALKAALILFGLMVVAIIVSLIKGTKIE